MALRNGHGSGKGVPRIEVLPADELPQGLPASGEPTRSATASVASKALRERGDTTAAAELGRLGGLAKAARDRGLRALDGLGLKGTPPDVLAPYLSDAEAFAENETRRFAAEVGAGFCSPTVGSMIQSAALALAASRALYASGDYVAGSKLANDSRQNLMAGFEICAREAKSRPRQDPLAWLDAPPIAPPQKTGSSNTTTPPSPANNSREVGS